MGNEASLVVTAGEPAGVGPELCLALAALRPDARFAIVADPGHLDEMAASLSPRPEIRELKHPDDALASGAVNVIPVRYPAPVVAGHPDPANAAAVLESLDVAVAACLDGTYQGLVTAPLQKSSINDAGIAFSGHTEYLAGRCGVALPVMLLTADSLRVALATTHLPLRAVPDAIQADSLEALLRVLVSDLEQRFGLEDPKVLVCGLNPHAGEGGHLGKEDDAIIRPVVDKLRGEGMKLAGPVPADTAFTQTSDPADAILAMYHDQGLPALKARGFGNAVNVTLGLPIVRTSVDHGTALDIAGKGIADPGSLLAAFDLALELGARIARQ